MVPVLASILIPGLISAREQAMMAAESIEMDESPAPAPTESPAPGASRLTRMLISSRGPLATQLELFNQDVGHYPSSLDELFTKPESEQDAGKWSGPYIKGVDTLEDEWGNGLQYAAPGVHNADGYDLWSVGPDGEDGTGDDVTNWEE
jgi:type II secretion system protein G